METQAHEKVSKEHLITVTVNNHAVEVAGPKATGLEIKQAAIARGLRIELSFVLSEELPDRHTRIVGDTDVVTITKHSRFIAVAPDDNS